MTAVGPSLLSAEDFAWLRHQLTTVTWHCKHKRAVGGATRLARGDGSLDGMWMVCFDQGVLTPGCVIYSFGIGSDWSFDEAMATGDAFGLSGPPRKGIGCAVHAFDPTMGLPSHVHQPGTVWFQPTALGAADGLLVEPSDPSVAWANGRAITGPRAPRWRQARLHTLLRDNGHRRLSLLKIDIESFEWAALAAALRDGALDGVDQLLFEAHLHLSSQQLQAAGGVGAFRSVLEALDAASFRLFSSVPNPFGNSTQLGPGGGDVLPSCFELSFVRTRPASNFTAPPWNGVAPSFGLSPLSVGRGRRGHRAGAAHSSTTHSSTTYPATALSARLQPWARGQPLGASAHERCEPRVITWSPKPRRSLNPYPTLTPTHAHHHLGTLPSLNRVAACRASTSSASDHTPTS